MNQDPHRDGALLRYGAPLEKAAGSVILLHGRGGSAEDILSIVPEFHAPHLTYLAPEAPGNTWYPNSFMAPREKNEPWLTSALNTIESTVRSAIDAGVAPDRIVIGGFSQGACLSSEFVVTHPRRYAALLAFTGGLIGPPDADLTHEGDLQGMPAFFGSGEPDPHVPWLRVEQSAQIVSNMGGIVTLRRYPGRPHTITADELAVAAKLIHDAF